MAPAAQNGGYLRTHHCSCQVTERDPWNQATAVGRPGQVLSPTSVSRQVRGTGVGLDILLTAPEHPHTCCELTWRHGGMAAWRQKVTEVGAELRETGTDGGYPVFSVVSTRLARTQRPKNLIFATLAKPDIRFRDGGGHRSPLSRHVPGQSPGHRGSMCCLSAGEHRGALGRPGVPRRCRTSSRPRRGAWPGWTRVGPGCLGDRWAGSPYGISAALEGRARGLSLGPSAAKPRAGAPGGPAPRRCGSCGRAHTDFAAEVSFRAGCG